MSFIETSSQPTFYFMMVNLIISSIYFLGKAKISDFGFAREVDDMDL